MSPRTLSLRTKICHVIGAVMFALGSYIALHPLWSRELVTQSRLLDLACATFFLVKGWRFLRQGGRRPPSTSPPQDAG